MSNKYVRFGETIISQEAQEQYVNMMAYQFEQGRTTSEDLLAEVQGGWLTWEQYDAILASGEEESHETV